MHRISIYLDIGEEAVLFESHGEFNLTIVLGVGPTRDSVRVNGDSGAIEDALVDLEAVTFADLDCSSKRKTVSQEIYGIF